MVLVGEGGNASNAPFPSNWGPELSALLHSQLQRVPLLSVVLAQLRMAGPWTLSVWLTQQCSALLSMHPTSSTRLCPTQMFSLCLFSQAELMDCSLASVLQSAARRIPNSQLARHSFYKTICIPGVCTNTNTNSNLPLWLTGWCEVLCWEAGAVKIRNESGQELVQGKRKYSTGQELSKGKSSYRARASTGQVQGKSRRQEKKEGIGLSFSDHNIFSKKKID